MSGVKLFRREDQDFSYEGDLPVTNKFISMLTLVYNIVHEKAQTRRSSTGP